MGGSIRSRCREYEEHSKQNVWSDFRTEMQARPYVNEHADHVQDKDDMPLRRIVDLSLKVLAKRYPEKRFPLLFRSLSVIRKQQSVPMTVLQKIWGFITLQETNEVIRHFYKVSLIQVSREYSENVSIQLHDLVLDVAKHEAARLGESQIFYDNFIKKYSDGRESISETSHRSSTELLESNIGEDGQRESKVYMKWWSIPVDGYIHENVCNLLRRGEKKDELLWLLSQPELIIYRFLNGGVLEVEADINEGIVALEKSASSNERREHLEIISSEVRLSGSYVHKNPSESWFQLYGRLQLHATINKRTETFIRRIERAASRPWVKASIGVVHQASLHVRGILQRQGRVLYMRMEKGVVWVVCQIVSEIEITSWDINTGIQETIKLDVTYFEKNGCFDNPFSVFQASFSGDGLNVTLAHDSSRFGELIITDPYSLRIGIFKLETGELGRCLHLKHKSNPPRRNIFRCCLPSYQDMTPIIPAQSRIVVISKDGKYIATSNDEDDLQVWSAVNGEAISNLLRGHTNKVECLEMNKEGTRVVTGGRDNTIRIWNAQSGEAIGSPLRGHTDEVLRLTMSVDGTQVVSGAQDNSVRLWDIEDEKSIGEPFLGHEGSVRCVQMSEDGSTIVSGSDDGTLIVWDVQKGVMKGQPLRGHTLGIRHIEIGGDGSIAVSASDDGTVRVWDMKRNEDETTGTVGKKNVYNKCVSSGDGRRCMVQAGKDTAKVMDTLKGEAVGLPIRFDIESVLCMGMSADNRRGVFGLMDGTLIVFDAMTGERIGVPLRGHTKLVWCVVMSRDGRIIVSGSGDDTIRIWDTESGESIGKPLVGHSSSVSCLRLTADGRRIVSGSWDTTVRIWDAKSGEAISGPLRGHTNWINCFGISPDGTKVVSGSDDCTVRVWDVQSSQQIGGPFQHDDAVYCVGIN